MVDLREPKERGKPCPKCGADTENIENSRERLRGIHECTECGAKMVPIVESYQGEIHSYWNIIPDKAIK